MDSEPEHSASEDEYVLSSDEELHLHWEPDKQNEQRIFSSAIDFASISTFEDFSRAQIKHITAQVSRSEQNLSQNNFQRRFLAGNFAKKFKLVKNATGIGYSLDALASANSLKPDVVAEQEADLVEVDISNDFDFDFEDLESSISVKSDSQPISFFERDKTSLKSIDAEKLKSAINEKAASSKDEIISKVIDVCTESSKLKKQLKVSEKNEIFIEKSFIFKHDNESLHSTIQSKDSGLLREKATAVVIPEKLEIPFYGASKCVNNSDAKISSSADSFELPPLSPIEHVQEKPEESTLSFDVSEVTSKQLLSSEKQAIVPDSELRSMFKELLKIMGLHYIVAEGEAEVCCVALQKRKIVDYIASDDTDCLVFGGTNVIRNFCSSKSNMEIFALKDIKSKLHLTHDQLILLSLFLGSDYCSGVKGIGPVKALSLMCHFKSFEDVVAFRKAFADGTATSLPYYSLCNLVKNDSFESEFPNAKIYDYYKNAPEKYLAFEKDFVIRNAKPSVNVIQLVRFMHDTAEWKPEYTVKFVNGLL